ncbi:unnamed protein product [Durusdinium trenchii]|uniref:Uncharacterized protein n=1 Tax=Durusdinium trenchii TaxID=1381693 RepID=A0ABP0IY90_9DINO
MLLDLGGGVQHEGETRRTEVIATTRRQFLWSQDNLPDWLACYSQKLEGANETAEGSDGLVHACSSCLGCSLCIALLGIIQECLLPGLSQVYEVPLVLLATSWGAAVIHVFCTWHMPCAQPKSVILGNLIGAIIALLAGLLPLPDLLNAPKAALVVSVTVAAQELLGAVHPAGAATALLLSDAQHSWHSLGLTMGGSVLIVTVGVLFNNVCIDRFYPQSWWPSTRAAEEPPGRRLPPPGSYMMHAPEEWLNIYWQKLQGGDAPGPTSVSSAHACFSALVSFVFMLSMAFINEALGFETSMLAAAAVASSSVFSDWQGASSQPWPCLMGCFVAALCGGLSEALPQLGVPSPMWMRAAFAVGLASFMMELANAVFPAGGAIALAFVVMPAPVPWISLLYTGMLSSSLVIIYGTLLNNLQETRLYPRRWPWQRGIASRHMPFTVPEHRHSERSLVRRWNDDSKKGTQYSQIYVGVLTVGLQFFFLIFLFFAEFDASEEGVASMCNSLAWISMAVLAGLAYSRSFLKAYGLGAVGFSLLILCVAVQWSMIVESLLHGEVLRIGFTRMMRGYSAAAAVLVSFGALIGKVDALQILTLVVIEIPCYCWNKVVFLQMDGPKMPVVHDGRGLSIFLFGSFFGFAAGKMLGVSQMGWLNRSQRSTELLSLMGTCCLWVTFPALTSSSSRASQHTVLALLGSGVTTFIVDGFLHEGRLQPTSIRSAVLAGGVALSGVADLLWPFTALAVGCVAGALSTIALHFSNRDIDTSGILQIYALPSLLGGLAAIFAGDSSSGIIPGNQAMGFFGTLIMATFSGAICGQLLGSLQGSVELAFSDEVRWACAEDLPRGVLSL